MSTTTSTALCSLENVCDSVRRARINFLYNLNNKKKTRASIVVKMLRWTANHIHSHIQHTHYLENKTLEFDSSAKLAPVYVCRQTQIGHTSERKKVEREKANTDWYSNTMNQK